MILHSVQGKGIAGLAARAGTILSRFGPTPERINRCLDRYIEVTDAFGVRSTLCVTASILARHPDYLRGLYERGTELAIHGLVHVDHRSLSVDEQERSIARAGEIFRQAGIQSRGFRAPYLRFSEATDQALRRLDVSYHSSQAVAFSEVLNGAASLGGYHRALDYYRAADSRLIAVRPRNRDGLMHIPVALPDDEIMVDRLRLTSREQAGAWLAILETTHRNGELFTLQLHPERIFDAEEALWTVLREARRRRPQIWLAALDEIADWWRRRGEYRISVDPAADGYRVRLEAGADATLLVRGLRDVPAVPWYGRDAVSERRDFVVAGGRKPVVGMSERTPSGVAAFVAEEGWLIERSDTPVGFGAYLDIAGAHWGERAILERLEQAPGPLVRLWRWPRAARSALAVTGDIDSLTLQDFVVRLYEGSAAGWARAIRG
jgi:hypothetical protein